MASSLSFLTLLVLFCIYMPIGTMSFSMRLISRVNIDPMLFPKNISLEEKNTRLVQLSKIHALNYHKTNSNATIAPQTLQPIVTPISNSFLYAVEMLIGTPPFKTLLVLDTGSSDTWVQCDGCNPCFPIKGGNFKYRESKTFKEVSCDDPLCDPKICSPKTGKCAYALLYQSGPSSRGIVLSETFTFPVSPNNIIINKRILSFKGVAFGCGLENKEISWGEPLTKDNVVGGIFGIGTETRSFLKQLSRETNMRFSYCLTLPHGPMSQNYLHFGPDAKISGDFKTTPLVTTIGSVKLPHYHVVCKGISLLGKMLPIDPKVFQLKSEGIGGFVLDTGSDVTFLVESAYRVLKKHVDDYFKEKYGLSPFTSREKLALDLCYLNAPNNIVKPTITYHFEGGADFVVDSKSVFMSLDAPEGKVLCLAVEVGGIVGPSILGSRNQVDHTFLFDVGKKQVSFVPLAQTCGKA
ncbi:aspartic proteinase nepenthesin-2 [Lathyrus oleraceus]|uniref:aspartic proteinase nepenthesin-2 n=1 Tax=Pisum sativum TaxID=3888 RepID=UPI0021D0C0DE|nr:aspartic proteinase nepenthesin-2-like [Pisum sativum]